MDLSLSLLCCSCTDFYDSFNCASHFATQFTIATLQKQVEKSREELATEKTDNERLKKMLASLQSTQSDQISTLMSEVEELRIKVKKEIGIE